MKQCFMPPQIKSDMTPPETFINAYNVVGYTVGSSPDVEDGLVIQFALPNGGKLPVILPVASVKAFCEALTEVAERV